MSFGSLENGGDDFGKLGDFGSLGGRRPAQFPALPPPESAGLLRRMGQGTLSTLGWVGGMLDKYLGGRAVRGGLDALMGRGGARELLSPIPLSDTLGLTDPSQVEAHRGSQLFQHATGIDPEQQRGYTGAWAMRNLLGPGVELGLDPSNILGGVGAFTKAGKLLAKAGTKVPWIMGRGSTGFLGAVRRGERTLAYGWTGPRAAAVAEAPFKAMGAVNRATLRKIPGMAGFQDAAGELTRDVIVPTLDAWTHRASGWIPNRFLQAASRTTKERVFNSLEEKLHREHAGMADLADQIVSRVPRAQQLAHREELYKHLTDIIENIDPQNRMPNMFTGSTDPAIQRLGMWAERVGRREPIAQEVNASLKPRLLQDPHADYLMRARYPFTREQRLGPRGTARLLETKHPSMLRREPAFTGIPGGKNELEHLIQQYGGQDAKTIQPQLWDVSRRRLGLAPGAQFSLLPTGPEMKWQEALAKRLSDVDPTKLVDRRGNRLPFYVNDPIRMSLTRGLRAANVASSGHAAIDAMAQMSQAGGKGVNLFTAASKSGLSPRAAAWPLLRKMGVTNRDIINFMVQGGFRDKKVAMQQMLKGYEISSKDFKQLTQYLDRGTNPYELKPFIKWWNESILQPFKTGVYTIMAPSHVRNYGQGKLENFLRHGISPWHPAYKIMKSVSLTPEKMIDTGVPGFRTPKQLLTELYANRVIGTRAGEMAAPREVMDQVARFGQNPLAARRSLSEIRKATWGAQFDPTRPWKLPWQQESAVTQAGQAVNDLVEERLRGAQAIALMQQGYTAKAAANEVFKTHFDYERGLAPMESKSMRSLFTFPTFSRFNIPKQIQFTLEHPGRVRAQLALSGQTAAPSEEQYVPRRYRTGLAIPIPNPANPPGHQTYITNVGTGLEEAAQHLRMGTTPGGTLQETALQALSMLRPDIKNVLEYATGRSFHTGEELKNLDPGWLEHFASGEAVTPLQQMIGATPATRMLRMGGQWFDPRRRSWTGVLQNLADLTTGIKSSNVDVEKFRSIDQRKILEEMMKHSRNIREMPEFYVPKWRREFLTPQDIQNMRLYASVRQRARKEAKRRGLTD